MTSSTSTTGSVRADRGAPARVRLESDTLYRVIGVVASSPDLDRLLASTVELLTEATDCHACFIYLLAGKRLRLRVGLQRLRARRRGDRTRAG